MKIKVSDYIIQRIYEEGVSHIFTLAGGGCIHLIDSLGKHGKIKNVSMLHEQPCSIAAESYSQITNNIGVCIVTTGPGGSNAITGIAAAFLESSPMLIICGQVQTKDIKFSGLRQRGFQELDNAKIYEPITKFSKTILNKNDVVEILEESIFLAKNNRKGPVFLEIPLDIQGDYIDVINTFKISRVETNIFCVQNVINLINKSKRPVVLAGNGIRLSNCHNKLVSFLENISIPVLLTWKTIDFFDENYKFYIGRPGTIAQRGANFSQQFSDLVICIGARLDYGQINYNFNNFAPNAKKIIVDIDEKELEKFIDDDVIKINCCASYFLDKLIECKKLFTIKNDLWLNTCRKYHKKFIDESLENPNSTFVNLYNFIDKVSINIPNESIIVSGSSGTCSEVVSQSFKILKNNLRVYNTHGLGAMGFGISAAIGAYYGNNEKKSHIVTIDGDGGFAMNMQELQQISNKNIPIKFFILNNGGYISIRNTQKKFFNSSFYGSSKSDVHLPKIKNIAKCFGIRYVKINSDFETEKVLKEIFNNYIPYIVEVNISENHITKPRCKTIKTESGFSALPMEYLDPELSEKQNIIIKKEFLNE